MGVIKRGILGGFSGAVGNVVGSSWKGIATMKSKPLSVANPNTAAQITQRGKMASAVAFAKQILTAIIKPLNDRFASGMSGYNLFVKRNIDLFLGFAIDPTIDFILSSGNVTAVEDLEAEGDVSANNVVVEWNDNTGDGNALASDVAYAIIHDPDTGIVTYNSGASRTAETMIIPLPEGSEAGDLLNCWLSFRRADGTQVSDSRYFQVPVVA